MRTYCLPDALQSDLDRNAYRLNLTSAYIGICEERSRYLDRLAEREFNLLPLADKSPEEVIHILDELSVAHAFALVEPVD